MHIDAHGAGTFVEPLTGREVVDTRSTPLILLRALGSFSDISQFLFRML